MRLVFSLCVASSCLSRSFSIISSSTWLGSSKPAGGRLLNA